MDVTVNRKIPTATDRLVTLFLSVVKKAWPKHVNNARQSLGRSQRPFCNIPASQHYMQLPNDSSHTSERWKARAKRLATWHVSTNHQLYVGLSHTFYLHAFQRKQSPPWWVVTRRTSISVSNIHMLGCALTGPIHTYHAVPMLFPCRSPAVPLPF
jgi:hypothetical protein